jgi:hypothetical protein
MKVCGDALGVLSSESKWLPEVKPRGAPSLLELHCSKGVVTKRQISCNFLFFRGFCDTKKVPSCYLLGIKEKKNYVKHFEKRNIDKHTGIPCSKMPHEILP